MSAAVLPAGEPEAFQPAGFGELTSSMCREPLRASLRMPCQLLCVVACMRGAQAASPEQPSSLTGQVKYVGLAGVSSSSPCLQPQHVVYICILVVPGGWGPEPHAADTDYQQFSDAMSRIAFSGSPSQRC
jgi:hypothetical protein